VIRSALEVRRRSQFYLWAQGQLHSLIPHEVLVCAFSDPGRRQLTVEHFSSYPIPAQDVEGMNDPESGLVVQVASAWAERGGGPLIVCGSDRASSVFRRFESTLSRYAFPNMLVHGMPLLGGAPSTCFLFANLPQPVSERLAYLVNVCTPYVHLAFTAMLATEKQEAFSDHSSADRLVTDREVEILRWVRDGKSNQEIGVILRISPLTVKNHVQKILKKLNAQNRAQAVAKAMSLQILRNDGA
jgi:transcriptional regulator EpsA